MIIKRFVWFVFFCVSFVSLCGSVHASCSKTIDWGLSKTSNLSLILNKDNVFSICSVKKNSSDNYNFLDCSNRWIVGVEHDAFSRLPDLENIDLSCNRLAKVNFSKSNLSKLLILNVWYNSIESISDLVLDGLGSVNDLYLDGNRINKIDTSILSSLSALKYLNLGDNNVYGIDKWDFDWVTNLKELDIKDDYDYIQVWAFSNIKELEKLSINLPGTQYAWIFSWLDNLSQLSIDLWYVDNASIIEWFFSWLNNIIDLTIVWFWDNLKLNNLNLYWLEKLRNLVFSWVQVDSIFSWKFLDLNIKNLSISRLKNIEKWMFNDFDSLEILNIWEVDNIWNWWFDWLTNLKRLNIYVNWIINDNAFDSLSNLNYLNLQIKNKNILSKRLLSNLSNLDTVTLDIDNREEFDCHEYKDFLWILRVWYYYDSLWILKTLPMTYTYKVYTFCKYVPIFVLAFIILLILVNIIRRKRWRFWIMFSYFTMKKFSDYLSNPKRWWHIFMKIIFVIAIFIPLLSYIISDLIIPYYKYNKFDVYYETFDTFENRYTDSIVNKAELLKNWEIPSYVDWFFKEWYKLQVFDMYADYWCSNIWDVDRLKKIEKELWKPFDLVKTLDDRSYLKILDKMNENGYKCVENLKSSDILNVREYSGYTMIWKTTFVSVLLTLWYYILCVWACLLVWLLLAYILMFLYYNILLIFINWKSDDELEVDKLADELSDVEIDEIEDVE